MKALVKIYKIWSNKNNLCFIDPIGKDTEKGFKITQKDQHNPSTRQHLFKVDV